MLVCRAVGPMALLFAAAAWPTQASAEIEHVHIRFSAPQRCPDSAAFTLALHQRTERFQLAGSSEQVRTFVVTITQADALVSGRLEILTPEAEPSLRSVTGKSCDEVMAALAFMTALSIDPRMPSMPSVPSASTRPPSTRTAPPAGAANRAARSAVPETTAAAPPPPSAPAPALPPPASTSAPALPDTSLIVERTPATPPGAATAEEWKWSAGLHGGTSLGISPTTGLGALLFIEAAAPGTGVLGPVLRAGLYFNQSDTSLSGGAEAEFQWVAAMLEGCPLRLAVLEARIAFHSCLAIHLGVLRGQGQNLDQPAKTTDLWADLGPVMRVRLAVSSRFFLETQGMIVVPLRRMTYDVYDSGGAHPASTAFAMPGLGALVGIGVAYQFR